MLPGDDWKSALCKLVAVMCSPRNRLDQGRHDSAGRGINHTRISKIRANLLDHEARPGEDETRQEGMINMSNNQPSYGSVIPQATPLYATTGGFKFEVVVTPSEV